MEGLTITRLAARHIDEVYALELECFSHPWTRAMIEHEMYSPLSVFWVAQADGAVAGYLDLMQVCGEGHIASVAVSPRLRRRGIAAALMRTVMRHAQQNALELLTLEVRASSAPARALYEGFGFRPVGLRRDYYESPREDAVIMTLYLTPDGR